MKTKLYCLLSLSLLFQVLVAFAQDGLSLQGTLLDSTSQKPIPFASLLLSSRDDGISDKIAVTDTSGIFRFDDVFQGKYRLSISYLDRYEKNVELEIVKESGIYDIGSIIISIESRLLKEVIVEAQDMVRQGIDRITYNVFNDPIANSANAMDIMRRVPLLTIDGEDNIRILGMTNYRITVDGKPSMLMARSAREALRSMPASSIHTIEVITNPPGRYQEEGVDAIINITTKKRLQDGHEGSIHTNYRFPAGGPGIGVTFVTKRGKLAMTNRLGYTYYKKPYTERETERFVFGPNGSSLNQFGRQRTETSSPFIGTELSYEIDSLSLLTARLGIYRQKDNGSSILETQIIDLMGNPPLQSFSLTNENLSKWNGIELGIDYQKSFSDDKAGTLTVSYLYADSRDHQGSEVGFANIQHPLRSVIQSNKFSQEEHTVQIDYTKPIGKSRMDAGVKGIARLGNSDFDYRPLEGDTNILNDDVVVSNLYKNNQYIALFYNSYQYELGNWGVIGGFRLEGTKMQGTFQQGLSFMSTSYYNFIPNLAINYKIKGNNSLNLIFKQSLRRPNISYLNPFVDRQNPTMERSGNPNLDPVIGNNINLQYSRFKKSSLIAGLTYAFSNNMIQQVLTSSDTAGIARYTYGNIGSQYSLGFNLNYRRALSKRINANLSGNITHTEMSGTVEGERLFNSGLYGSFNAGIDCTVDKTFRLNGVFSYTSPIIFLLGETTAYPYYTLSGSKEVVPNRLSVSANVINPFSKFVDVISDFSGPDIVQRSRVQSFYRTFLISVSYSIGGLNSSIRKSRKGIENDDSLGQR